MFKIKMAKDGDIVFNSIGRLQFTEDISQDINLRFRTEKGELFYNEDFGRPILKGKITRESINDFIASTISDMENIADFEIISYDLKNSHLSIHVKFFFQENETEDVLEEILDILI
jgi:hypothetical protein